MTGLELYTVPRPGRGPALVTLWDGRPYLAAGEFAGLPVYRFRAAPSGLATVRQLRAGGLRRGGQPVAGWLAWGRSTRPRWAALYRLDLAKPKRKATAAQLAALARASAVRLGVEVRPGGPSAKTFHRAGAPNHQSSKENAPSVRPVAVSGEHETTNNEWIGDNAR